MLTSACFFSWFLQGVWNRAPPGIPKFFQHKPSSQGNKKNRVALFVASESMSFLFALVKQLIWSLLGVSLTRCIFLHNWNVIDKYNLILSKANSSTMFFIYLTHRRENAQKYYKLAFFPDFVIKSSNFYPIKYQHFRRRKRYISYH